MKKFIVALLTIVSLCWSFDAPARFPRGAPVAQNVVNMGGGPNMLERSLFATNTPTLPYSQWYVPGNGSPAMAYRSRCCRAVPVVRVGIRIKSE